MGIFSIEIFSQIQKPIPCNSCGYGFDQIGYRQLVGKNRKYFGSEKSTERKDFSAKPAPSDRELILSDVFPAMGDVALFRNYSPDGWYHLTELPSDTKVFKAKGMVYAFACENLLELEATNKYLQDHIYTPPTQEEEVVVDQWYSEPPPQKVQVRHYVTERPMQMSYQINPTYQLVEYDNPGCYNPNTVWIICIYCGQRIHKAWISQHYRSHHNRGRGGHHHHHTRHCRH